MHPLQALADDLLREGRPSFRWVVEHAGSRPLAEVIADMWNGPPSEAHPAYARAVDKLRGVHSSVLPRWTMFYHWRKTHQDRDEVQRYECVCCLTVFRDAFDAVPMPP